MGTGWAHCRQQLYLLPEPDQWAKYILLHRSTPCHISWRLPSGNKQMRLAVTNVLIFWHFSGESVTSVRQEVFIKVLALLTGWGREVWKLKSPPCYLQNIFSCGRSYKQHIEQAQAPALCLKRFNGYGSWSAHRTAPQAGGVSAAGDPPGDLPLAPHLGLQEPHSEPVLFLLKPSTSMLLPMQGWRTRRHFAGQGGLSLFLCLEALLLQP